MIVNQQVTTNTASLLCLTSFQLNPTITSRKIAMAKEKQRMYYELGIDENFPLESFLKGEMDIRDPRVMRMKVFRKPVNSFLSLKYLEK